MMAGKVADVPSRRWAPAGEFRGNVDECHERELRAAECLRLVKPEESGLVQQLLVFADEHARVLGRLCALAQGRHDLARPAHGFVVADGGEIAPRFLRQGADGRATLARGGHGRHVETPLDA
jgi:hypothetical protein